MADRGVMTEGGPGPVTRLGSRGLLRQQGSKPYVRTNSCRTELSDSSSGLTGYVGEITLSFDEAQTGETRQGKKQAQAEPDGACSSNTADAVRQSMMGKRRHSSQVEGSASLLKENEAGTRASSSFGRVLYSMTQRKAEGAPRKVRIMKADKDAMLGIVLQVPADDCLKGVVVTQIDSGFLISRSKKLRVGDVIHAVNGLPISTPQQGASLFGEASGDIEILMSRANAKAKQCEKFLDADPPNLGESSLEDGGSHPAESTRAQHSSPAHRTRSGRNSSAEPDMERRTTVVVSCSQLILECKRIVGRVAALDEKLDELYASLKAKEISSQNALQSLSKLVGQGTVEQAGLVIAHGKKGQLPNGWVEYFDKETSRSYYYNA
ncbi:MAG: hypothetical protein SGPRY_010702 [Prymnesium sp.]